MMDRENSLLPFFIKIPKREKSQSKADGSGLLIIVGGLLVFIVVVAANRSIRGAYAKRGQLSRSQRGIGVGDEWVDGYIGELKKRLIPLTMNNLLVAVDNLHALLNEIQTLISAAAHGEDTSEHF
jgi:hypothetical protein